MKQYGNQKVLDRKLATYFTQTMQCMEVSGDKYDAVISDLPYGLVVRIPGFHPGGPGSIPGVGT